jgi:hypothetical protein
MNRTLSHTPILLNIYIQNPKKLVCKAHRIFATLFLCFYEQNSRVHIKQNISTKWWIPRDNVTVQSVSAKLTQIRYAESFSGACLTV